MAKRANGEGTLSRRKDKSGKTIGWRAAVTVGYDANGAQDRRWVSGKTQAEVQEKMRALQSEVHTGMLADAEGLTVGAYLERWIETKERDGVKPNTVRSYRDTARLYLTPHLGRMRLDKLRPLDVERALTALGKAGKSAQLMAYALRVLKMALRQAVRWQMLPRNVAEGIRAPKITRPELHVWTPEQVAAFLDASQAHRLHAAFYLALMTGMRRGKCWGCSGKTLIGTARVSGCGTISWKCGRKAKQANGLLEADRLLDHPESGHPQDSGLTAYHHSFARHAG